MKPLYQLIIIVFILNFNASFGQKIAGYSFDDYKVTVIKDSKKAKINYSSNPTAKEFKTEIAETYKDGKIDFAGHYITMIWSCGSNACTAGVMVDVLTGKVYDLPFGFQDIEEYFCSCDLNKTNDCYSFNATSNLFVTCICTAKEASETNQRAISIFTWNEKDKKFVLLEKVIK